MINDKDLKDIIAEAVEKSDGLKDSIFDIVTKIVNLASNKESEVAENKNDAFADEDKLIFDMEAKERERKHREKLEQTLKEQHKKYLIDLLERLRTEKLYTFTDPDTENDIITLGYWTYNPVVTEVFKEVGAVGNPFITYENHLATKSEFELTEEEIKEQFLFWYRGERFSDGLIAEAIDSGQFTRLFYIYLLSFGFKTLDSKKYTCIN